MAIDPSILKKAEPTSLMAQPSPENLLMAAAEMHRQGRFQEPDSKPLSRPKKLKLVR